MKKKKQILYIVFIVKAGKEKEKNSRPFSLFITSRCLSPSLFVLSALQS
jgi:hypothetical protein